MSMEKTYKSFAQIFAYSFGASLGLLTYSFQSNCMNDLLNTMLIVLEVDMEHKGFYQGLLTSSVYFTMLIGCFLSYLLLGRLRLGIFLMDAFLIGGSLIQLSDSFYIFVTGRLVAGFGSGLSIIILPIFQKQFSPVEVYGIIGGMSSVMFALGFVFSSAFGLFFVDDLGKNKDEISPYKWRIQLIGFTLPSIVRMILMTTVITFEPPIYYIRKKQYEKAKEILGKIYLPEKVETIFEDQLVQATKRGKKVELYKLPYLKRTLFAYFFGFFYQGCGYYAVLQYSTVIFQEITSPSFGGYLTLIISILKLLFYLLNTYYLIQRLVLIGRRITLLIGTLFMLIANIGVTVSCLLLNQNTQYNEYFRALIISFIFLFLISNFSSLGPMMNIYIPEIVSEIGFQVAYSITTFATIVTLFGFPLLKEAVGMWLCFGIFSFITFLGLLLLYFMAIETKNKTDNEIDEIFLSRENNQEQLKLNQASDNSSFS